MNDNEEDLFPQLVEAPPEPEYDIPDEHIESEEDDVPDDPLIPDIKPREKIEQQDIFIEQKSKKMLKLSLKIKLKKKFPVLLLLNQMLNQQKRREL